MAIKTYTHGIDRPRRAHSVLEVLRRQRISACPERRDAPKNRQIIDIGNMGVAGQFAGAIAASG